MASVYIIYSKNIDAFYTGSCKDLHERLSQHNSMHFIGSFTSRANDWELFHSIEDLSYDQARVIEKHIKRMKSRKYFQSLKQYPEVTEKLIHKYKGSFR